MLNLIISYASFGSQMKHCQHNILGNMINTETLFFLNGNIHIWNKLSVANSFAWVPGLADVFVWNVTIISIIYFTEYQVVQRETTSSAIVHMVNYIMLSPHMTYSLLFALEIIIKRPIWLTKNPMQS